MHIKTTLHIYRKLAKQYLNRGYEPSFHYWRDSNGHEIDLLITKGMTTVAGCEIKATHTYKPEAFKHLDAFGDNFSLTPTKHFLVYSGDRPMATRHGIVHNPAHCLTSIPRWNSNKGTLLGVCLCFAE